MVIVVMRDTPCAKTSNTKTCNDKDMRNKTIKTLATSLIILGSITLSQAAHHGDMKSKKDIVDVASDAGVFNTLVAAVSAADLVETLKSGGPFTVFAPTDDAFAKLPAGTLEFLLEPENKNQLIAILTYHVVPGRIMASDVKPGRIATVNRESLTVSLKKGSVYINNATVTQTDVDAANGVIHIIDTVLFPDS